MKCIICEQFNKEWESDDLCKRNICTECREQGWSVDDNGFVHYTKQ